MFKVKVLRYGYWLRLPFVFETPEAAEAYAQREYPSCQRATYKKRSVQRIPLVKTNGGRRRGGSTYYKHPVGSRVLMIDTPVFTPARPAIVIRHGRDMSGLYTEIRYEDTGETEEVHRTYLWSI